MSREATLRKAVNRNGEIMRSVDGSALIQEMFRGAMGEVDVTPQQVALMKDLRSCLVPTLQSIEQHNTGELETKIVVKLGA